ncbi:helix-turn-helix domain-containing protein [Micromonospora profundi]|uniref:helix-turn-helix domain-containing protein n=1 Tax=Micromonospora profundi TaxID=1420889 RepID=UPI00365C7276
MPRPGPATSQLQVAFGLAVRRARTEQGMSQEQLAASSGLDRTYVSGLERGRRNPTLTTQQRLATALGLSVAALIASAEEMP